MRRTSVSSLALMTALALVGSHPRPEDPGAAPPADPVEEQPAATEVVVNEAPKSEEPTTDTAGLGASDGDADVPATVTDEPAAVPVAPALDTPPALAGDVAIIEEPAPLVPGEVSDVVVFSQGGTKRAAVIAEVYGENDKFATLAILCPVSGVYWVSDVEQAAELTNGHWTAKS
jgi:hypothetical protein